MVAGLLDFHQRELVEGSAIDPTVIAERGYYSLGRPEAGRPGNSSDRLRALGIGRAHRTEPSRYPGFVLPIWDVTGRQSSLQWKPATPAKDEKGRPIKYASPSGRSIKLDVHPRWTMGPELVPPIKDAKVPLFVTEGIKKADSLTSRGCCTIALAGVFNWRNTNGTLGDWEDVALKGRQVTVIFDADARTNASVARAMARFGGWLRSRGASVRYCLPPNMCNGKAVKGVDDWFAAGGTLDVLLANATSTPPSPMDTSADFTDSGLAERLADEVLDGRFCWAGGLGWMSWDGARWVPCSDVVVVEAVRQWATAHFADAAAKLAAGQGTREAVDAWRSVLGHGRQKTVVSAARGIDGVLADPAAFDADPWILNASNGIVDLRTGELREHDPAALCTKLTEAAYVPGARHPDWDKALEAVIGDAREWLQRRYGQAITGKTTPDDLLIVQQGGGSNGKTTIMSAIGHVLGSYCGLLSDRVLLANPNDHPTELMDLRGLRLAVIEETPEARRLNVNRLKKVIGTPEITARHIAKDSVTFKASHSTFLSTNYLPLVEETDHGTWRRLAVLPFPYRFHKRLPADPGPYDRQGDPNLRDRLLDGSDGRAEAVLAWLVEGAVRNHEAGGMPDLPASVEDSTAAWRADADVVFAYVQERLEFDPSSAVLSLDLLADINEWLAARGLHTWGMKLMESRLRGHDLFAKVDKRRVRGGKEGLSRPLNVLETVPGQATAWLGVRFAGL